MSKANSETKGFKILSFLVFLTGLLLAFYYIFQKEIVTYNIDFTDTLFWASA